MCPERRYRDSPATLAFPLPNQNADTPPRSPPTLALPLLPNQNADSSIQNASLDASFASVMGNLSAATAAAEGTPNRSFASMRSAVRAAIPKNFVKDRARAIEGIKPMACVEEGGGAAGGGGSSGGGNPVSSGKWLWVGEGLFRGVGWVGTGEMG